MRSSLPLLMLVCFACPFASLTHAKTIQPLSKRNITAENSRRLLIKTAEVPEELTSQVADFNEALHYLYDKQMQLSQLKHYQQDLQQGHILFSALRDQLDIDDYEQMSFINNYATLLSN